MDAVSEDTERGVETTPTESERLCRTSASDEHQFEDEGDIQQDVGVHLEDDVVVKIDGEKTPKIDDADVESKKQSDDITNDNTGSVVNVSLHEKDAKKSPKIDEADVESKKSSTETEITRDNTKSDAKASSPRRSVRVRRSTAPYGFSMTTPTSSARPSRKAVSTRKKVRQSVEGDVQNGDNERREDKLVEQDFEKASADGTDFVTAGSANGRKSGKSEEKSPVRDSTNKKEGCESSVSVSTKKAASSRRGKKTAIKAEIQAEKKSVSEEKDPFDLDESINSHPEPLDNVVVERQCFGEVKFGIASSSNPSTPKYMKTEQNAKEILASGTKSCGSGKLTRTPQRRTNMRNPKLCSSSTGKSVVQPKKEDIQDEPMDDDDDATTLSASPVAPSTGRKRGAQSTGNASAKRLKPSEPAPPVLSAEEQVRVDYPEDPMRVPVGGRVYALYDKFYYPAIVVSYDGSKYRVYFIEDKQYKNLTDAGIIPIRDIKETIQVDATVNTQKAFTVEIKSVPNRDDPEEWSSGLFEAFDDEKKTSTIKVTWDKISFDIDQAKPIEAHELSFSSYCTGKVVASAVIAHARSRRSGVFYDRDHPHPESKPVKLGKEISSTPVIKSKKAEPLPSKKLFLGKQFVLTSASRPSGDGSKFQTFNKKEMKRSITIQGGIVLEDLMTADSTLELYLIADTHYRTFKYLNALAFSVPCVSYNWLKDCFAKNEFLDRQPYMLSSGINIMNNETVEWHPNNDLLKDKRVFLCGFDGNIVKPGIKQFSDIWTPMVERLGGRVLKDLPEDNGEIDFFITDGIHSEKLIQKAKARNLPVLSSEWIIQSIIVGKLLPYDGNEKFILKENTTPVSAIKQDEHEELGKSEE